MAKLRKQCKKTKEILSANNLAPMSVESLHDGMDFRSTITREKFAEMIIPSIAKMVKPLKDLLDQTGVDLAKVEGVEMLGGGTRIPAVLDALTVVLGGRAPDR
jgi:hypoxia up-regulated 1